MLGQMLRLASPYWNCERKARVRGATLALFLLTVCQVGLTVWGNYWNRALFDALEARSVPEVLVQVGVFALIFAGSIVVTAAHLMVKRWLQLDWRAWLTDRLVGRWMADGRHYRLTFSAGDHDNPDGRIAEDVRIATESAIALAHTLVFSVMILGTFVDILWEVSGVVTVPGTALQVPGYMVPLAVLYAGAGTIVGWLFGRPLVRTTNALQTAEASFRFGLARAREQSESIALMHGEAMERARSGVRFREVVRDWDRQSLAYMGIVSFSTGYGALLPVFPLLVAAPQYIMGEMTLGVLMQAAQAFQKVTSALSWPVDNVGEIARCRASADRALALHLGMQRLDLEKQLPAAYRIELGCCAPSRLKIEALTITEPSGRILIEDFSCEIRRGERVLVMGDPAVTTSLFQVIGGLWAWGRGRVLLPADGPVLFMPQRPFLPEGTLREALCYPQAPDAYSDSCIRHALECAGLAWLRPRLDEQDNWARVLPLRGQQQLGLARAVMQRPAWILMEEATDAFDPKGEQLMLEMLRREVPGAGMLTISVHPGLEHLHDRKIVLNRLVPVRHLFHAD
ncbi:MAG: ABC transporter ATP-binding protein/permease [Gammaproteobacteria bacterium]|nr:MAG: ABC transporter ATP-binding protein/permease [Gammaproteobacteria bacterium]